MTNNKLIILRKGVKMITFALIVFLGLLISLLVYLTIVSPGKPDTFKDENGEILEGSISEKTFIPFGGVKQGMFIRSKNINNPVLLYLHGGPGFPNYFLVEKFNPGLEDDVSARDKPEKRNPNHRFFRGFSRNRRSHILYKR